MSKAIKKIAKVVVPVAASFIPGVGPLGAAAIGGLTGAVTGGGLKGALLGAVGSGLGNALFAGAPGTTGFGLFDSAQSSLYNAASPLRSVVGNIFGSSSGSAGGALSSPSIANPNNLPWLAEQASSASSSSQLPWVKDVLAGKLAPNKFVSDAAYLGSSGAGQSQGFLSRLGDIIKNPSMNDVTNALQLYQMTQDSTPEGMLSQKEIMNQMNADKAKQQADNEKFIASLNSAPMQRTRTNSDIDYYNYGSKPENLFFENVSGGPLKFAKGGLSNLGGAGGQDDTVDAKLSQGEYVIPADVVSHLGDGNTQAGAKSLDQLLKNVRKHKAPALKKGVLPPKAKSPLAYIGKAA